MGTVETRQRAEEILKDAKDQANQRGWNRNLALILRNLGRLATDEGNYEEAQECLEESLSLWEQTQDSLWRNGTTQALADLMRKQERRDEAKVIYKDLDRRFARAGFLDARIEVRAALAMIAAEQGQCEEARSLSSTSLEWAGTITYPSTVLAYAYECLSRVKVLCGRDLEGAIECAEEARKLYESLGMSYHVQRLQEKIDKLQAALSEIMDGPCCKSD
jgi:tetratricopeptide (TPR) repeat protein